MMLTYVAALASSGRTCCCRLRSNVRDWTVDSKVSRAECKSVPVTIRLTIVNGKDKAVDEAFRRLATAESDWTVHAPEIHPTSATQESKECKPNEQGA